MRAGEEVGLTRGGVLVLSFLVNEVNAEIRRVLGGCAIRFGV